MVERIMIKKQLVGITFYAIVIYFTCGLLASAFAVSHPLSRDGTHFCGVTHDQPRRHRVSKGLDNRNYARTFANLNVGQPRTVRLIYFLPNDRTSQPDIDAKMDELIKEAQQVFAGQMDYYGFGRKTFRFETDVNRKAVVHHVNGRFPDLHYQTSAWTKVEQEVSQRFDLTKNIYLIALDVSSEDLDGSWCGQGGYMEPDGGMVLIPASGWCFEESDVTVHELGHAFGLLHDFRNDLKPWIDLYSTEPMTTSRCANEWLAGHRYFNVRQTDVFDESTTIQMEPFGRAGADSIELRFDITDVNGLHQAQLFTTVEYLNSPDLGIFDCKTLKGNSSPVEFIVPISELAYRGEVDLQVIDAHGNFRQDWYPIDIASLDPIAFVADASPTYSSGEVIPTLPTGSYFPNVLAGGSFQSSGGVITITFRNDGLMVVDGITYTCVASGGCRIDGRTVTQGLIQVDGTEGEVPVDDENIMDTDVDIPDPNLRAAIESALGKASGASILLSDMANLTRLDAPNANISDLTGLEDATNLKELGLGREYVEAEGDWINSNSISDLSPLRGLTNLTYLNFWDNNISDITALRGLTNLTYLNLGSNSIVDISAVSSLTNLTELNLWDNSIVDISAVSSLTNLTELNLWDNSIVDISAVAGLTNLTRLDLQRNNIVDISAVAGLTNLTDLLLEGNSIRDLSPVADLTNLTFLVLDRTSISDISAVAGLTNLIQLNLWDNNITDLSPLAGLTNLTYLYLYNNNISDLSPLVANTGLGSGDEVDVSANPLSFTSINTHIPALQSRGVEVFFYNLKPPTLEYTLSIPAGISLIHVPLRVTAVDGVEQRIESVGDIYAVLGGASTVNYLITYDSPTQAWLSYFSSADSGTLTDRTLTDDMGIMAGMKAPVSVSFTGEPLGTGGSGSIHLNQGLNLVGLPLNDSRLNRVSDLLSLDGIRNNVPVIILTDAGAFKAVGRAGDPGDIPLTGGGAFIMTAQRAATVTLSGEGWTNVSDTAASPSVVFRGIESSYTTPVLALRGAVVDEHTGVSEAGFRVTVKNLSTDREVATVTRPDDAGYRLTVVDIETGHAAGVGDILEISARTPDPSIGVKPVRYTVTAEDVKRSLIQLPELLAYEIPAETELLHNYPNPFNPETWIPYHLASDADVQLTIYDINGGVVRRLDFGHQPAGYYTDRSDAAYWDGRNDLGGTVGSGVYFYHLSAGEYSATKKMVILK